MTRFLYFFCFLLEGVCKGSGRIWRDKESGIGVPGVKFMKNRLKWGGGEVAYQIYIHMQSLKVSEENEHISTFPAVSRYRHTYRCLGHS